MGVSFLRRFLWAGDISVSLRPSILQMFERYVLIKLMEDFGCRVADNFLQGESYEPSLNQENGPDFLLCLCESLILSVPASAGLSRLPLVIFGILLDVDPYCVKIIHRPGCVLAFPAVLTIVTVFSDLFPSFYCI